MSLLLGNDHLRWDFCFCNVYSVSRVTVTCRYCRCTDFFGYVWWFILIAQAGIKVHMEQVKRCLFSHRPFDPSSFQWSQRNQCAGVRALCSARSLPAGIQRWKCEWAETAVICGTWWMIGSDGSGGGGGGGWVHHPRMCRDSCPKLRAGRVGGREEEMRTDKQRAMAPCGGKQWEMDGNKGEEKKITLEGPLGLFSAVTPRMRQEG